MVEFISSEMVKKRKVKNYALQFIFALGRIGRNKCYPMREIVKLLPKMPSAYGLKYHKQNIYGVICTRF